MTKENKTSIPDQILLHLATKARSSRMRMRDIWWREKLCSYPNVNLYIGRSLVSLESNQVCRPHFPPGMTVRVVDLAQGESLVCDRAERKLEDLRTTNLPACVVKLLLFLFSFFYIFSVVLLDFNDSLALRGTMLQTRYSINVEETTSIKISI